MGKNRTIPKKVGNRCPMCAARFEDKDVWSKHLVDCGNRQMILKKFECPGCDYAAVKKCDLDRHQKRSGHSEPQGTSDSEEDWEEHDQGYILSPQSVKQEPEWSVTFSQEEVDLNEDIIGSSNSAVPCSTSEALDSTINSSHDTTSRKRTSSTLPIATKAKIAKTSGDMTTTERNGITLVDAVTQTEAPIKSKMRRKTVTYHEGAKTIEEIVEEHWTEY
ncbi:RE1-silencing transcription factor-like [Ylistrum balloti]|uniref:RE1-silencing transcription factor-like n=1 Tax=Ylistrum balloti TaxID=509963 RepID=UPI002905B67B|nr:RE1-silencing transcription factor-like [Ylistrum balloti]